MDFLLGKGILPEFLLVLVTLILVFFLLAALEYLYNSYYVMTRYRTVLIKNTVNSNSKTTIIQDPSQSGAITVFPSGNERTGIEFAYSFFLYVNNSTFNQSSTSTLKHVFYKGYAKSNILMGPGVFIDSTGQTNKMRVVMNSFKNWRKYIEIDNLPIDKWFHVALVYRGNSLEVYINGNLRSKMAFENGDLPYQNFQDIVVFNQDNRAFGNTTNPAYKVDGVTGQTLQEGYPDNFSKSIVGALSRLTYFQYAIGFSEIQALMSAGASSIVENDNNMNNVPPYLQDTWWTTTY